MAITQQPTATVERLPWTSLRGDTEGEKIRKWFENEIWGDRQICSNCFARLRTSAEVQVDEWGNTTEVSDADASVRGVDVVAKGRIGTTTVRADDGKVRGVTHRERHTAKYHAYSRTTCGECGSVGGLAASDALPKPEAVDRVPDLVARLHELGHAVDAERVYQTVRHLKSDEERTDDDKCIFATAAALGIKHG